MAYIVLFHSVYGLRPVELAAADQLRAAGHEVVTPDLYAGQTAVTIHDGFALADRIGWAAIEARARESVRVLPADAVLAGFSMGAGVVSALLAERPETAGVLLLHGTAEMPVIVRDGLPVQLHIALPDEIFPAEEVISWEESATEAGAEVQIHTYLGAGHFYTDPDLADYDQEAAALTWRRALGFLDGL
ncbi:dienelactone hydrolase family protein [Amycolatopsis nigrescens]|uniref:dienelactone hydrolase family protein n=1 Tax=Amycolatopsis nigrescens TaxID=381445 RepID=UPI00035F3DB0|nr:dienelactone hydrolase family protein [Amycolatopsis nigrescens]